MKLRPVLVLSVVLSLAVPVAAGAVVDGRGRSTLRPEGALPKGFVPAAARLDGTARYFVVMKQPSLAQLVVGAGAAGRGLAAPAERRAVVSILVSQESAIREAESLGGQIVFRYARLANAFSAQLSAEAALALAERPDVARVEAVPVVVRTNETSVPFIGATKVWRRLGVQGRGMTVGLVDTGIDYTHKDFGGPGTVEAYESNDPDVVEPGTFPTRKVIDGYDFVGGNYDVLDDLTSNDLPDPDRDPLDVDGHGTHTGGTCCGNGVPGSVGRGVAPKAKLLAIKVWDVGNSTADVLVAGYEFAVDPNGDGRTTDAVDVLSFSGGVDYGPPSSVEAQAAQGVVDLGTVFVASAGNSGNQPTGGSAYILGTPAGAPGVVGVAASIDQFVAQTLDVNTPSGVDLPDRGIVVRQDWSGEIAEDITGDVIDAREVDPPDDPSGTPAPTDRMLCDATPSGTPFAGDIALVFKGSTGAGDCDGSEKVYRAQQAGASAVILWSGFGGFAFGLGPGEFADQVTVPAVMVSGLDGQALGAAASPDAPDSYNTGNLNVTINAGASLIPGFADRMTDFTSEGPARVSSGLKPDISAPGSDITSAGVGTGDGASVLSGTSMAAPHVSGVAVLLRQLHPNLVPLQIKALMMNQATQDMENNDGTGPVPAEVMGAGRVQAFESATAVSVATPGSLSFGLRSTPRPQTLVRTIRVKNFDSRGHDYDLRTTIRYNDYARKVTDVSVSPSRFHLDPHAYRDVQVRLTVNPNPMSAGEQEYGWYYFMGSMDGNVLIRQSGGSSDTLHVPWHVVPLAASDNDVSRTSLDLTDGTGSLRITDPPSAGASYADIYLLGTRDGRDSGGEEDIAAIGARSFTGGDVDGTAEGLPEGTDPLVGLTWLQFLTNDDEPTEPVEFGVRTYGLRNTTESLEVDVLVDAGADGVF
ncbi:MAG: S8 family serine peptidase, partial [Actinobacteria bacterium]|nr:S8 family serine peptidase [Actinomycetota bacterium]